jgi:hypothetical protein
MRLGKRHQEIQVPGVAGVAISVMGSRGARRSGRSGGAAASASARAATPTAGSWTPPLGERAAASASFAAGERGAGEEPVVEGEAVELPSPEPARPIYEPAPPTPDPMPFPVADEPVAVVTPGAGPAPVTSLGDSGEAFASGHAAAPGSSWQQPVMELARERPELAVAAAFAGGVVAALILRRLGS